MSSRILTELGRAQKAGVDRLVDIVICDGGSTDGSMNPDTLELYGVNTLLVKTGPANRCPAAHGPAFCPDLWL